MMKMGLEPLDGEVGTGMWEAGKVGSVSEYGEGGAELTYPLVERAAGGARSEYMACPYRHIILLLAFFFLINLL